MAAQDLADEELPVLAKGESNPLHLGRRARERGTAIPMHGVKRYALDGGSFHVTRSDAEFWHPT
jgi:hypothetical protein